MLEKKSKTEENLPNSSVKPRMLLAAFVFAFTLAGGLHSANAAHLYFDPDKGDFQPGDSFDVQVRIDPEGECVNAMDITIKFASGNLQLVDISRGESILPLWVKPPEADKDAGTISFIGGVPGGYCGRIPGDPGVTNNLIKIAFRIPGFRVGGALSNTAKVEFSDASQVLLNDGRATKANLTFGMAEYSIVDKRDANRNDWLAEVQQDNVPPEPFKVDMQQSDLFGGKYVIVFNTTDKQTGLDHFEVLEADAAGNVAGTFNKAAWKTAQSPYVLEDQKLHSIITVKAIDKASNERIFEYTPPGYSPIQPHKPLNIALIAVVAAISLLLVIILAFFLIRRRRARSNEYVRI
jgi:hypothetical protein